MSAATASQATPATPPATPPAIPATPPATPHAIPPATSVASTSMRERFVCHLIDDVGLMDAEAKDLEIGVYNWLLQYAEEHGFGKQWSNRMFTSLYVQRAMSMLVNLDAKDGGLMNTRLLPRMRDREFLPHELAWFRPENTFPERWRETLDLKVQKDEYILHEKPAAMTDQFRCGRCKKRECIYQELQLRSCDEPVSIFITCLNCGNRWRVG